MTVALLKSKTDNANVTTQQNSIIKYAKSECMNLDTTEIESSKNSTPLEERSEFKGFLRSLSYNDHVLIYDLWVLSSDPAELIKILECLLDRFICLHITNLNMCINRDTCLLDVITILSQFREKNLLKKVGKTQGRPKGRMSTSKFDPYRVEIIDKLTQNHSVSMIARDLGMSRTSLKDYINSRGLKELVKAKSSLLSNKPIKKTEKQLNKKEECSLIKEK